MISDIRKIEVSAAGGAASQPRHLTIAPNHSSMKRIVVVFKFSKID
jgi:hypothetical protein